MVTEYKQPDDMKQFGRMIGDYASAVKNLADSLRELGVPSEQIRTVAGRGRYNTLEAQGYIINGPQATADARHNMEGLWGAFYYIHKPELELAQQSLELLRQQGCRLKVTGEEGRTTLFPLHKIDFENTGGSRGKIFLKSDAVSDDGKKILPQGTVLMQDRKWAHVGGMPHDYVTMKFDFVDAQGRSLGEKTSAQILWGNISSMGIKALGIGSPKQRTIGLTGNDDDFAAEDHMVEWLKALKRDHQIDLMPIFNAKVVTAREALVKKPELLRSFAGAIEIADMAKEGLRPIDLLGRNEGGWRRYNTTPLEQKLSALQNAGAGIRTAVDELGLTLPPPPENDGYLQLKQRVRGACDAELARKDAELKSYFSRQVHTETGAGGTIGGAIEQLPAFSPEWFEGKGNVRSSFAFGMEAETFPAVHQLISNGPYAERVKKLLPDALMRVGRKNVLARLTEMHDYFGTYTGDVFRKGRRAIDDIRTAVDTKKPIVLLENSVRDIRAAYEAAEPLYAQKMADSKPDVHLAPVRDPHYLLQIEHAQVGQFLEMMDKLGCDQQKWFALYGDCRELIDKPGELPRKNFFDRLHQRNAKAATLGHGRGQG